MNSSKEVFQALIDGKTIGIIYPEFKGQVYKLIKEEFNNLIKEAAWIKEDEEYEVVLDSEWTHTYKVLEC